MQAVMWVAFLVNLTAYPLSNGLLPNVAAGSTAPTRTGLGYLSASFAWSARWQARLRAQP